MTVEMVTLTIDGMEVTVPRGTQLIEAAKSAGVVVPHYCYHPSLPSPAVCRMCLVEVENLPKMVPSCVTTANEGQVVHVHSEAARKAREGVLEFLLINHPLDCPICDQAGECELQDFVFQEGQSSTRYADYPKRFNPVEDFGPDILYVPNRCILCTRCVRFMDDVADTPVLTVAERGDRAFIGIDESQLLDHEWSGNVVDLCPVGSLVSKDFLHKARAWDLDKTASVCTGCSQGCNVTIDTRDGVVVRIRPRANLEVNRHFICDTGRSDYRWMNRGDRLEEPMARQDGELSEIAWDDALERLSGVVGESAGPVVVLFGGRISTEGIGWVLRMLEGRAVTAAMRVPLGEEIPLAGVAGLALRSERAANVEAARILGADTDWNAAVGAVADADLIILVDVALEEAELESMPSAVRVIELTTVAATISATAELVLPITAISEEQGVLINRDGRAQRYLPARDPVGSSRPAWWVAATVWGLLATDRSAPATASEALASLDEFSGLSHEDLGFTGRVIQGAIAGGGE